MLKSTHFRNLSNPSFAACFTNNFRQDINILIGKLGGSEITPRKALSSVGRAYEELKRSLLLLILSALR